MDIFGFLADCLLKSKFLVIKLLHQKGKFVLNFDTDYDSALKFIISASEYNCDNFLILSDMSFKHF